jgi:hypothetical protein
MALLHRMPEAELLAANVELLLPWLHPSLRQLVVQLPLNDQAVTSIRLYNIDDEGAAALAEAFTEEKNAKRQKPPTTTSDLCCGGRRRQH